MSESEQGSNLNASTSDFLMMQRPAKGWRLLKDFVTLTLKNMLIVRKQSLNIDLVKGEFMKIIKNGYEGSPGRMEMSILLASQLPN
ncbi:hypothetical protein VIGAN_06137400 [Vigna angularis var. angularis]|uniref:Uncharacterized protein n=1 Tax=Vigna angularis var. angularis TaxID=157739 RepID=A0A0S3SBC9_PHAAN|nr:hypothetical protein VIGAN_06137400 [Vigna angularis var. angularis]